ncbi:MAG: sialate O-acetylesterase [Planctomycetota bacterium]|jgi:sialate O-acetylesterase
MQTFRVILVVLIVALAAGSASADVTLPAVFSDHMVLQHGRPLPVWGRAEAGEKVTVSIAGRSASGRAASDGRWEVRLEPLAPGGPHALTVRGANSLTISDVLIGDVWLCSGQSNMQMAVRSAMNSEQEQAAANHPHIRHFKTASLAIPEPQDRCEGSWAVCSPETVGAFTATGYFFGRELHKQLDIPIGLINSSWGGTAVEAWTSWSAQEDLKPVKSLHTEWADKVAAYDVNQARAQLEQNLERWKGRVEKAKAAGRKPPRRPTLAADPAVNPNRPANLFNGMIHPLIPYAIRGAIWYQGERNTRGEISKSYGLQLRTMIYDWRSRWGYEFPFAWVQLPNFTELQVEPTESTGWVMVREGMLKTLDMPNTGMAITVDIGEARDIHPKNKQDVGLRLATWALADVYGKPGVPSGPLYESMDRKGDTIVVHFGNVGGKLIAKGDELAGFAVAGADRKFVWADAKIAGETLVVSSAEVKAPVAVRYAWAPNPNCNLYNSAGLPASPFRTDDWPIELDAARR